MKFVKFLPSVLATVVLAACANVSEVASSTASAVGDAGSAVVDGAKATGNAVSSGVKATKEAITGTKKITYTCSVNGKANQPVSAVYTFNKGEPATATVTINKKVVGKNLKVDTTYTDGVKFVAGQKVWSLDTGFNAQTAETTAPVMFTANDVILAKNCAVAK